jgi:hypothetical protein
MNQENSEIFSPDDLNKFQFSQIYKQNKQHQKLVQYLKYLRRKVHEVLIKKTKTIVSKLLFTILLYQNYYFYYINYKI